jgi:hypothetical protein
VFIACAAASICAAGGASVSTQAARHDANATTQSSAFRQSIVPTDHLTMKLFFVIANSFIRFPAAKVQPFSNLTKEKVWKNALNQNKPKQM